MPTAPGPRFVLEAGFLVLLAFVVGLADLDPLVIVLVMLVGWILVSLIEYFAWRQSQSAVIRGFEPAYAGMGVSTMSAEDAPPPPATPPPAEPARSPDEDTVVEPPSPEQEVPDEPDEPAAPEAPEEHRAEEVDDASAPAAEEPAPAEPPSEEAIAFATRDERRIEYRLEPLKPRPRRKWIIFGPYRRQEGSAEDDNEA
jgi:hypothetical protein